MVVDPSGEQLTMWSATQIPHILQDAGGRHHRRARTQAAGHRAGRRRRVLRRQAAGHARGDPRPGPRRSSWASRSSGPRRARSRCCRPTTAATRSRTSRLLPSRDGTVPALKVELLADMGAYLGLVTPPSRSSARSCSTRSTSSRGTGSSARTCSPRRPTDAYRGAGRPEATFAIERTMDELAAELGREPMDVREQNWIKHEEFPFTTVAGLQYDSGNYEAATAKATELFGYEACAASSRSAASGRLGPAGHRHLDVRRDVRARPVGVVGWRGERGRGWEPACIRMLPFGKVEVVVGSPRTGRGTRRRGVRSSRTSWACRSRTSRCCTATPRSRQGLDTYGSRSLVVGGIAVVNAAQKVVAKARKIAAHMLEASEDDLEFSGGRFGVQGTAKGVRIRRSRRPGGRTTCPRAWSRRSTPTRRSIPRSSPSPTAPISPRWRSTRRRGGRRCAATSASTTSARR